jgi:hypothetical protein
MTYDGVGLSGLLCWPNRHTHMDRATSRTGGTLTDSFPSPQERAGWMISHCARSTRRVCDRALREHRRGHQAPSPPLLREQRKLLTPLHHSFCDLAFREYSHQYSFNVLRFTFNLSRRIRRHEHENFETLCCVVLHTMFFAGRRHGPLPWTEHLFL